MTTMSCAELGDVACELALDLLGGKERAAALEHLAACASCRQEVASLADAAEEVLTAAPDIEPSAGFERTILERIERMASPETLAPAVPMRRRRLRPAVRAVLVLAALVAVVLGAAVQLASPPSARETALPVAEMRTAHERVVGEVALQADPAAVRLTIPDWAGLVRSYDATVDARYWVAVETADGSRDLHRLPPADRQPWTVAIESAPDTVTAVSVVDNRGNVWCTARVARS